LGAGWYSTQLLSEVAKAQQRRLITLDTSHEWLSRFAPKGERLWHDLRLMESWDAPLPELYEGKWGLVFVDTAPPLTRGKLVERLLRSADVFVLHDTESPGAYGYDLSQFRCQMTDKAHWTWTTVASNTVDVTQWGLEEYPTEEKPRNLAQYLLRLLPTGYFVEAGAHNGGLNSDGGGSPTYELERAGWKGLCIEPSPSFVDLVNNRRCRAVKALLGPNDDEIVTYRLYKGNDIEMSGILSYLPPSDRPHKDCQVKTNRLSSVMNVYNAPKHADLLVLHTNGSELAILQGHDFAAHRFKVIVVGYHGMGSRRQELVSLLEPLGYVRSRGIAWDDGTSLTFVERGLE